MTKRLIAFLGLGSKNKGHDNRASGYEVIAYRLDDRVSRPVELVQAALDEILGPFDHVTLLATNEVEALWSSSIARVWRDVPRTPIPDGKTEKELWTIFDAVVGALNAAPEGSEIVLDVTHGFRVLPMIGLAALTFWLSERARLQKAAPRVRVTYGAYDAADDAKIAPIWDGCGSMATSRMRTIPAGCVA